MWRQSPVQDREARRTQWMSPLTDPETNEVPKKASWPGTAGNPLICLILKDLPMPSNSGPKFIKFAFPPHIADWHRVPNRRIPLPRNPGHHFDEKHPDGAHPCLILDVNLETSKATNQPVNLWIRSATSQSGFRHPPHSHASGRCSLDKPGRVLSYTFPVRARHVGSYICEEPADSQIIETLNRTIDQLRPDDRGPR